MADHHTIYQQEAQRYDALVRREDMDRNLLAAIEKIIPLKGIDVVESGAGTGRLTLLLAPLVHSIKAFDLSPHMLALTTQKLEALGLDHWETGVADHRDLPMKKKSADLVISGWSVCYLNDKEREDWQKPFLKALKEFKRILRPGGKIILIETEGTGVKEPHPPKSMVNYLSLLKEKGFQSDWIRTDYLFTSWQEVMELVPFFFGEEMVDACFDSIDGIELPECTGVWSWSG
jgi:ubiquinone/menaquinone biosynthesis C-methylase UbiE